ncbi:uncharacterized protein LOC120781584 [Bactrocera tryoni]|uniref:uncharacterized protein LOC120781584 n=1 Tax=Bactrocera tryoni TaxID=59916 RepID=UPI001A96AD44|nr:uncharacterized protein LOC120781584 [Bactrocera tryoni]
MHRWSNMMESNDIFNVTPPSTSTPKGLKRKKVQLSHNFYASSSRQVLTPHSQNMFCSEETATASEGLDANKDIMAKLDLILEKQLNLESRLDKLEENKFSNCMDASTSKRKSERALSKATTGKSKNAIC